MWKAALTPFVRLYTRGTFVGYPPVGAHLVNGLTCFARNFKVAKGEHLTFHLGTKV